MAEGGGRVFTFGSLFAGIGGMDLGLERAGMRCKWQVEIDPFCTRVLEKHWPEVKRYGDIRELTGAELEPVDLIAGGFPCQDVSEVGARKGIAGLRSGLWTDMQRIIRVVRPAFVLVENVSGLFNRGFGAVLGGLAEIGYDAEWSSFSACSMGASHSRERVFVVAYPNEQRLQASRTVRNGDGKALDKWGAYSQYVYPPKIPTGCSDRKAFASEPELDRVANGVPDRVHRLKSLGNAVVPQVAEWIGRRIMAAATDPGGAGLAE